ncbi:MAG: hypothetical protein NVS4B11_31380 [Ktedonobacteraceae bacterium]
MQAQCMLDYARLLRQQGNERDARLFATSALNIYKDRGTPAQVAHVQVWLDEL